MPSTFITLILIIMVLICFSIAIIWMVKQMKASAPAQTHPLAFQLPTTPLACGPRLRPWPPKLPDLLRAMSSRHRGDARASSRWWRPWVTLGSWTASRCRR